MGYYIVDRRRLDKLVFKLMEEGFYVSRHSYSYRLFYKGRVVAGIHIYPGFNEISVRLYKASRDLVNSVRGVIKRVVEEVFPEYSVYEEWYPPSS